MPPAIPGGPGWQPQARSWCVLTGTSGSGPRPTQLDWPRSTLTSTPTSSRLTLEIGQADRPQAGPRSQRPDATHRTPPATRITFAGAARWDHATVRNGDLKIFFIERPVASPPTARAPGQAAYRGRRPPVPAT